MNLGVKFIPGMRWSLVWASICAVGLCAVLVVSAMRIPTLGSAELRTLCVLFGAAYVGELLRLRGLGARGLSPVAVSAAWAGALATEGPSGGLDFGALEVVLVATLALLLGVWTTRRTKGGAVDVGPYAARIVVIATVAVTFRWIPLVEGRPLSQYRDWDAHRWLLPAVLVAIVIVAHVLEVLLQVAIRSAKSGRPWGDVLREDLREMVPTSLAALSTAVVIALGMRSLGVAAVLLFMVPLLLMRYAMQQQDRINAARRQTVAALSQMTDLAGYTAPGHAQRVAALCAHVGQSMGATEDQLAALESATLLHDIGQVSLGAPIPAGATVDAAPRDQQRIAEEGAAIARRAGSTDQVVSIIEQQAMPFRRLVEEGEPLTLSARILKVCNAYDDFSHGEPAKHENAILRLRLGLGYEYDPEVVEVLARVIAGGEVASAVR